MRQFFPEIAIYPGACYCADQGNRNHQSAGTDLRKQRAGARASHGPSQTKYQTADDLAFVEFFRVKKDFFAVYTFDFESFN